MIELKSERLKIYRLGADEMELLHNSVDEELLETVLGTGHVKQDELEAAVAEENYNMWKKGGEGAEWYQLWRFVGKKENVIIGGALFRSAPDKNGSVEIDYHINKAFHGHGYTSEAVNEVVNWALSQKGVHKVIAETEAGSIMTEKEFQQIGMAREPIES